MSIDNRHIYHEIYIRIILKYFSGINSYLKHRKLQFFSMD